MYFALYFLQKWNVNLLYFYILQTLLIFIFIYSTQLTNYFFSFQLLLYKCTSKILNWIFKGAHNEHFILQRKIALTMTSTKAENGKSAPSDADRGANRTLYVVFLSLVIDLLGFTLILPLLPSILDYYGTKQVRHSSPNFLSTETLSCSLAKVPTRPNLTPQTPTKLGFTFGVYLWSAFYFGFTLGLLLGFT